MKRGLWIVALVLLAMAVATLTAGVWLWAHGLPWLQGQVSIDGRSFDLATLSGGHALLLGAALLMAAAVLMVLLPLALLFVVALPLLLGGLALLLVFGSVGLVLALLFSPLLLLAWWLWKRPRPAATIGA